MVDVSDVLRELGFRIQEGRSARTWSLRGPQGDSFEVLPTEPVKRLNFATTRLRPGEEKILPRRLFIGDTATDAVVQRARSGGIDILTAEPNRMILHGGTYAIKPTPSMAPRTTNAVRPAWKRWAVARYLLHIGEPVRQYDIAADLRMSQQAVSNAARHYGDWVAIEPSGVIATNRAGLLQAWAEEYQGAGGTEFGWYSLDPIVEQTFKAAEVAALMGAAPLISGDVAADRIAPWKMPGKGRIYIKSPVDLVDDGFVPAPIDAATLITQIPRDPSIWALAGAVGTEMPGDEFHSADEVLVYWDVLHGNDADSVEAATHLARSIGE